MRKRCIQRPRARADAERPGRRSHAEHGSDHQGAADYAGSGAKQDQKHGISVMVPTLRVGPLCGRSASSTTNADSYVNDHTALPVGS